MQNYEESVSFLGTRGRFQARIFFLLCVISIPCGYNVLSVIFLLAMPPHQCHIPAHSNLSQEWTLASIPMEEVAGYPQRSSCSRYDLDLIQNLSTIGTSPEVPMSGLLQESCKDGWAYSTDYYQSTAVTEFNLVCSDQWKQPLTSLFYFMGGLLGCLVSGQLSDRFGRKPVLFGGTLMLSVSCAAVAFAPSWIVFTALFFLMGINQIACYIVIFVLGSEILVDSTRVFYSSLGLPAVYSAGALLLPLTAYLLPNWRHLSLIMAVPGLACMPLWWVIPESPRWLLNRGRLQEAEILIRSAAQENGVEAPLVIFRPANVEKQPTEKPPSVSFLDLLRTSNIRVITLILWLVWFSVNICYFGLSFNMAGLSGSPFLNYSLLTIVEFPSYLASWLAARSLPRRASFMCYTLLGAVALLLIQATLHSYPAITLALVLLGKFGVQAGNGMLYIFTGELSPTVIRNTAMSSCAMFARMGSAVSPYLLQLAIFYQFLPWIVVAALSLFSVILVLFLPETFKQPLPDTIEQMAFGQRISLPWPFTSAQKDDGKLAKEQMSAPEIICTTHL